MTPTAATVRKLQDAHPDLRPRVQALIDACPYRLSVLSVWRSRPSQQYLYDGWVQRLPGFNPANPPGKSLHETTLADGTPAAKAVDLEDYNDPRVFPWCHANAERFGLKFPYARRSRRPEPWHVEGNGKPWRPEEPDMTNDDRRLLTEVHSMLTALGAPRRSDQKDRDPNRIDLGDALTVLTREVRAVSAKVDKLTGGK